MSDHPRGELDAIPATFGGSGWKDRSLSHPHEVRIGDLWHRCGIGFEAAPLREVLLARPVLDATFVGSPNDQLMLEWPDPAELFRQADEIAACYRNEGVDVQWVSGGTPASPNFIFQRDLFFMTPEGAIVGRPAAEQRAREPRWTAAALAALGVPIVATMRRDMLFEGADALWVSSDCVIVGVGARTNKAACDYLQMLLGDMGVRVRAVPLTRGRQHLLGVVNFYDRGRAVMRDRESLGPLHTALVDEGVHVSDWQAHEPWGMNFVALRPNRVLMPSGCARSRAQLDELGVATVEVECTEYLKAAGGIGCLTGVIHRAEDQA